VLIRNIHQGDVGDGKVEAFRRHAVKLLNVAEPVVFAGSLPRVGVRDERHLQVDAEGVGASLGEHPAEPALPATKVDHLEVGDIADDLQHPIVEQPLPSIVPVLLGLRDPLRREGSPLLVQIRCINHGRTVSARPAAKAADPPRIAARSDGVLGRLSGEVTPVWAT
jgi:hypothetical protein